MMTGLIFSMAIFGVLLCAGCGRESEPATTSAPVTISDVDVTPIVLPPGDPRNEAVQAVGYPNHGEPRELGMAKFGGAMVNVTQYGPLLAGGEAHYLIDVGNVKVDGVYVWIGLENDGMKRRWPATPEPNGYHVHCSVPRPIKDDHALWVEIKLPSGERYHGEYYIGDQ